MSYPSTTLYPGPSTFPGTGENGGGDGGGGVTTPRQIQWDRPSDRQVEIGLDRGVFYPKGGTPVAWNGLTGVEESGGDGTVEYYIDGRPYLYFPKPKEYKATLKAFTYPDAFSDIMGEAEITDGMFLDSQIGDSFGLSYRTLVANATSGDQAAYKIHLIYNAVVVPSTRSFGTLGGSVNPNEFSWDIQAVPVPVVGYRPTAHVTIYTKHMEPGKIQAIETLLYGDATVDASMPDPQTIFDLLAIGDGILITDNGDGTWTAEGSYHNVFLTSSKTFQIDHVDAVDHGDGTYDISSTGV